MRTITLIDDDADQRLDVFIKKLFYTTPRSLIYKWIRTKKIKVNRQRATPDLILQPRDTIYLYLPQKSMIVLDEPKKLISDQPLPPIVYEDNHLLILDKPAGLAVHGGTKIESDHLTARVQSYVKNISTVTAMSYQPSPVHRLDRQTSGLVVYALNRHAHRTMCDHIRDHKWRKWYFALILGQPPKQKGKIEISLSKKPSTLKKQKAITFYKVIESSGSASLIEVELKTGRFRQIRQHFSLAGMSIVGETRYHQNVRQKRTSKENPLFLVAFRLHLPHPETEKILDVQIPLSDIYTRILNDHKITLPKSYVID